MTIREKALENIVLNECFKIRSMYAELCKKKLDEMHDIIKSCPSQDNVKRYAEISEKLYTIENADSTTLPEIEFFRV